jgi:hypothetical protein
MIKIVLAALLATALAAPNYGKRTYMTQRQVKQQATQISKYLKRTDRRVLREVLRQMRWQPVPKRSQKNTFDEWYIDLMRDFGGL